MQKSIDFIGNAQTANTASNAVQLKKKISFCIVTNVIKLFTRFVNSLKSLVFQTADGNVMNVLSASSVRPEISLSLKQS